MMPGPPPEVTTKRCRARESLGPGGEHAGEAARVLVVAGHLHRGHGALALQVGGLCLRRSAGRWPAARGWERAGWSRCCRAVPAHGRPLRARESAPSRRRPPCPESARGGSAPAAPGTRRQCGSGARPILIPKEPGPRRVADRDPDVHAQNDPQKQLRPLEPSWNALGVWLVTILVGCLKIGRGPGFWR
jgi:hypothetical protein